MTNTSAGTANGTHVPKSLTEATNALRAQIEAVKNAPPNEPDLAELWIAVADLQAQIADLKKADKAKGS